MFKITDMHGTTMMLVSKIEQKGDAITMKGNLMGTMPGNFYVIPEELWNMVKMVKLRLVLYMPIAIIKGMWRSFTSRKKASL